MADPFLGQIMIFAGNFPPFGWVRCDGSLLSIAQNDALFALLGTIYGGDGINTFALPNLSSRVPVCIGQGPGLSNYVQGQMAGTETVTLTLNQVPAHNHAVNTTTAQGNTTNPGTGVIPAKPVDAISTPTLYVVPGTGNNPNPTPMAPASLSNFTGGSQPHSNMMPTLGLMMVIAIQGVFPSRN